MLTTPRLILTPLTGDDAEFFYEINDDRTDEQRASGEPWPDAAQGHGYAYEACAAALGARGAAGHGHLPVVEFIDEDNLPSRRLAEKLGLVWDGGYNSRGRCVFELPAGS